jgi:hypothetical protein
MNIINEKKRKKKYVSLFFVMYYYFEINVLEVFDFLSLIEFNNVHEVCSSVPVVMKN